MNALARFAPVVLFIVLLAAGSTPLCHALSKTELLEQATKGSSSSATKQKKEAATEAEIQTASPEQLNKLLAAMSDQQVRQLLISTLQEQAKARESKEESFTVIGSLQALRKEVQHVRQRLAYVFSGAARAPDVLPEALRKSLQAHDAMSMGKLLLGLVVLLAIWVGVKQLLLWQTRGLRTSLASVPEEAGPLYKLLRLVFKAAMEVVFLALVLLGVLLVYLLLFNDTDSSRPLLLLFLALTLLFEAGMLLARFLLAPEAPGLRFIPLKDAAARRLYKVLAIVGTEIVLGLLLAGLLQLADSSEAMYLLVLFVTGLVVVLTIAMLAVWQHKEVAAGLRETFPPGTLRHQLAGSWHVLLIGYISFFWLFWVGHILFFGSGSLLPGLMTLLAFPLYVLLTWLVDRLVIYAGNAARSALLEKNVDPADPNTDYLLDEHGQPYSPKCPVARFRRILSKALSIVLFAGFVMTLASIWKIEIPIADRIVEGAVSILVTLILAYVFWAFTKAAIERKLQSQSASDGGGGDEPGAGGGDRLSTLLELVKRFTFVCLVVLVTLIVLSSMGVNTAPLMAGAGVLGIALGFGSQTLVKDIVSGVFFLMDDAFRIGDYVILGEAMGTVESISVRSLKLRHHRGRLFTVPYGSINLVDNMSRDWAIMKLEYMVPFDTDIQQVKKIVKRINKEIKEVPELAELMLGDIKSQGVKTMEEYGMRMRIKMTTVPGGQFTLRKWVWGKLRRYFDEAGIQFASKRVSVMLPEDKHMDKEQLQAIGAAAAEAAENEQQGLPPKQAGPS